TARGVRALLRRRGGGVHADALPVDVEVHEYMKDSGLESVKGDAGTESVVSTRGVRYQAVARREGVGVEANQREDAASVRVTFKKKSTGEPLGSYLLSVWCYPNYVLRQPGYQFEPQQLKVDGKTYKVELRPK